MDAPGPAPFRNRKPAAEDVTRLSDLRDQLSEYLATLEQNTDAVDEWLAASKVDIILFYQQLDRALNHKDEKAALALLKSKEEVGGFVLSFPGLPAKIETAFGKDSAFQKLAAGTAKGFPTRLQEPLPSIEAITGNVERIDPGAEPVAEKDQDGFGSSISNWWNKDEIAERKRTENLLRQMYTVKSEILNLQGDRHYYVDSLMDWVADTLAPEDIDENGKAANVDSRMYQFQNPAYVVDLALVDYKEVVEVKAAALRDAALRYAQIANTLADGDITQFAKELRTAYPDDFNTTEEGLLLQTLLLSDHGSASLAELILTQVKDRDDQQQLLHDFFPSILQEKMVFSDARKPEDMFEKFLTLVLAKEAPLAAPVLFQVMSVLKRQYGVSNEDFVFPSGKGKPNAFQRIADRFSDDLDGRHKTLLALMTGLESKGTEDELKKYIEFCQAVEGKNISDLGKILFRIDVCNGSHASTGFMALWYLCHPYTSLLDELRSVTDDPKVLSSLLKRALEAGILGETRVAYPYTNGAKFKEVMEENILPHLDEFSVDTARALIAHSFAQGGLDSLRTWLTVDGWLEKIVSAKIDDKNKLEWVAAVLEPFSSDVVKANILDAAARRAGPKAAAILSQLEKNIIGNNIRLADDKVVYNLDQIADIWYNSDTKVLRYTKQGPTNTLLDGVTETTAEEILSVMERRGSFVKEEGGLFRPENIDVIRSDRQGVNASWYRTSGGLNVDAATLQKLQDRPDFLHVKDAGTGAVTSYNIASIALLEVRDDGTTLMIDKYGVSNVIGGQVVLENPSPMIHFGHCYFNPDNASIIRLGSDQKSFGFRIEGVDFEKLLASSDNSSDQFFYTVDVSGGKEFKAIKKVIEESTDYHAYGDLSFNMKALEYMAFDEKAGGFYCKRYGVGGKPSFIQINDEEMVKGIKKAIKKSADVVNVGSLFVHKDRIDDVYYNAKGETLQFVIGQKIQEVAVDAEEASAVLTKLVKDKNFSAVTTEKIEGKAVPTDVVNVDHITLASYNDAQQKTLITSNGSPFPVSLARDEALSFFASLEAEGFTPAKGKELSWTSGIREAIDGLGMLRIDVLPLLDMESKAVLLKQALKKTGGGEVIPRKLNAEFATVATLPADHDSFYYPAAKKEKAEVSSSKRSVSSVPSKSRL